MPAPASRVRRAERHCASSQHPTTASPRPDDTSSVATMGEAGNAFGTGDWWKQSSLSVEPSTVESALFTPLELDSTSRRVVQCDQDR